MDSGYIEGETKSSYYSVINEGSLSFFDVAINVILYFSLFFLSSKLILWFIKKKFKK